MATRHLLPVHRHVPRGRDAEARLEEQRDKARGGQVPTGAWGVARRGSDPVRARCQDCRRRLKPIPARPRPRSASVAGSGTVGVPLPAVDIATLSKR